MEVQKTAYSIKAIILSILLIIESYWLTHLIITYIRTEKYLAPPMNILGSILLVMLLLIYTYALTIGGWGKWEQYLLVPVPIAVGIAGRVFIVNTTYAPIIGAVAIMFLLYDITVATYVKKQLIVFNPRIILKFSTKGLLFLFSLVAALLLILQNSQTDYELNIGAKVGEYVQKQTGAINTPSVSPNVIDNAIKDSLLNTLEEKGIPLSPEMLSKLEGGSSQIVPNTAVLDLDLGNIVEKEFNKVIEPYKNFLTPLIALLVFALVRFIGSIANGIFIVTSAPFFKFFMRIGFLHKKIVKVDKEEVSFSPQS